MSDTPETAGQQVGVLAIGTSILWSYGKGESTLTASIIIVAKQYLFS